jgi:ABC-type bacteriocin/lantibiotic exporter with double-glycine peptidase domain
VFLWESIRAKAAVNQYKPQAMLLQKLKRKHQIEKQRGYILDRQSSLLLTVLESLQVVFLTCGLFLLVYLYPGEGLPIGKLFSFSLYSLMFFRPLVHVMNRYDALQEARAHFKEAESYFNAIPLRQDDAHSEEDITSISCNKLQLAHVCQKVTFSLKKGELLVIKGGNGSGKSSLLRFFIGENKSISGGFMVNNKPQNCLSTDQLAVLSIEDRALCAAFADMVSEDFWESFSTKELALQNLCRAVQSVAKEPANRLASIWHQRFLLLRMMKEKKSVYLLDEVFDQHDPMLFACVKPFLRFALTHGMVLLVSHDKQVWQLTNAFVDLSPLFINRKSEGHFFSEEEYSKKIDHHQTPSSK